MGRAILAKVAGSIQSEEADMHAFPRREALMITLCLACTGLWAQTSSVPSVENDRVSRRCTGATLSTDSAAPCPDDVLQDRPVSPVVRPPNTTGSTTGTSGLTSSGVGAITPGTPAT